MGRCATAAERIENRNQAADAAANEVVADIAKKFQAVESLLMRAAERNARVDDFSPEEWLLFRSLNYDVHKLRTELARSKQVLLWKAAAGTAQERAAAIKRLEVSRQRLGTEGSQIREQLEKVTRELTGKLKALENEFSSAERACEAIDRAVAQLRANVPEHLATAAQISIERIRRPFFENLNAMRAKIERAKTFGKLDFRFENDRQAAIGAAKEFCPAAVSEGDASFLNFEIWQKYVSGLTAELPALEAEAEQCSTEMRLAIEAAKSELLDTYLTD